LHGIFAVAFVTLLRLSCFSYYDCYFCYFSKKWHRNFTLNVRQHVGQHIRQIQGIPIPKLLFQGASFMERFHFAVRLWLLCAAVISGLGAQMLAQTPNPVPPIRGAAVQITSTPVIMAIAGTPYRYQVRANAINASAASAIVYRLTTAPSGMTIDSVSGVISWLPASAATVRVAVRASLATNANVNQTQQFSINVLPASTAQAMVRFLTTAPTAGNVGTQYVYAARAFYGVDTRLMSAPRAGSQPFTYSLVNAPNGMTVDASNGTVRWTPGTTATVRFSIRAVATTVANTAVNNATQDVELRVSQQMPMFFTKPSLEAFVGFQYVYRAFAGLSLLDLITPRPATNGSVQLPGFPVQASIPMTYTLVTAPQDMSIEATSGVVRWTPTATSASVRVVIRVSAVGNTTQTITQDFTLRVSFPRVTFFTQAPSAAVIGQNYVYNPIAAVGNASPVLPIFPINVNPSVPPVPQSTSGLAFTLVTAPRGMTINAGTGTVNWTPSSMGTVRVSIRATLATNPTITGTQDFVIRVGQPQARFTSETGTARVNLGTTFIYRPKAEIPTMTTATLRYGLDNPPQGMTIDSVSGEIRWTPNVSGDFQINVTARLAGQTVVIARQNFNLYVQPAACTAIRGEVRYSNTTASVQNAVVRAVANATSANVRNGAQLVYTAQVSNGRFTVSVPSGAYTLAVTGTDFNEVWWGNGIVPTTSMATATPVTVNCGDTAARTITVTRRAAAKFFTLSGRVTRSATNTVTQATIEILGDAPPEIAREILRRTVRTDVRGNYSISLDDRFVYIVRALPDNRPLDAQTVPQYYTGTSQGTLNISEARKITLTADVPNINFALAERPVFQNSLSGKVQSTDGKPIAGRIIAFMTATTASTPQYASIDIRTENVDSTGTFTVKNLTPGEYVLQALPNNAREFSASYYKAGTTATTLWRQATRIAVTATSNERFTIVIPRRLTTVTAIANEVSDEAILTMIDAEEEAFMTAKNILLGMNTTTLALAANASNGAASESTAKAATKQATNTLTSVRNQTPPMQMLSIAPNPASSLALVQLPIFSGEARLEVFSMRGEELFRTMLPATMSQGTCSLDVTNFPSGVYVVRFYGEEVRASAQILVSR
jgi:Putative Ig domain